jgi:hypothetical protein
MAHKRKVRDLALNALKELLEYNPITGVFTWKVSTAQSIKVGQEAGTIDKSNGYRRIAINGKRYLAQHLAWILTFGEWATDDYDLDHINNIRDDNRIANLQLTKENQRKRCMNSNNSTGVHFLSINKSDRKYFYFLVRWNNCGGKQQYHYFPFASYGIQIEPHITAKEANEMVKAEIIEVPQEVIDFIELTVKPLYAPTHGMTAEQMAAYHGLHE